MNEVTIDRQRVQDIVKVATHSVAQQVSGAHPLEVLLAFSEATGRIIAAQEGSFNSHNELLKIAIPHVVNTVKAYHASQQHDPNGVKEWKV